MALCGRCSNVLRRFMTSGLRPLTNRSYCTTQPPDGATHQAEDRERWDEESDHAEDDTKVQLLQAAMVHVPTHGWSRKAIIAGAESLGLPAITHGLFPRGGADLFSEFYIQCNAELAHQMAAQQDVGEDGEKILNKRISVFIQDAVKSRLSMNIPYLNRWAEGMALMTLPQNAPGAWKNLSHLVDDIWYFAGDKSVDLNWYTKRLTLAMVYKSTEICMLTDNTEDFENSWNFLDRRLADLAAFGKFSRTMKQSTSGIGNAAWTTCTLARNMLGMNERQR